MVLDLSTLRPLLLFLLLFGDRLCDRLIFSAEGLRDLEFELALRWRG